ncbi:MAG: Tryptophan--tRNA ligase [Alphaproteobacteria bacterium MarineAlpha6_Bin4]|nr:MAG: Tryptophan--tRNA ligase [Alphaproteobacteria bacterium MarineAlpha6_Bin5]PPR38369.1 MAG: Tryptophan--tRNA ligase [Alphaproteobacteria bacterium MarineAlpha6_Bin4]|tara:strand:+ start:5363 stop:6361 length:999 start_codon:yes stop_codon:yes gene_type:complete
MNRIFSGVQPTGNLHLGNYLGAIKNWVSLQKSFECIFCIVDLHAITIKQNPKELEKNTLEVTAAYLASGIDPEKTIIFNQSSVSAHAELTWMLSCFTPIGWLNRMTQFKEKAGKKRENAVLGLFSYPVLMASDILAYKATHVPVGEDQKQHLELARDIAGAFNQTYNNDFFPLPEPQIFEEAKRIMSLRNGKNKMSKSDDSDYSRINITDNKDLINLKIKKAKTDAYPLPSKKEDLKDRPEAANLLEIYGAFKNEKLDKVLKEVGGKDFSSFKKILTDLTISKIEPISKKMNDYLNNKDYLKKILNKGKEKADEISSKNLSEIKKIIGLLII